MVTRSIHRRFVVEGFRPAYLGVSPSELDSRVAAAHAELGACRACPRDCGADRLGGELGTFNTGRHAVVASALPHFGEEDVLRGWNGSGTIFSGFCNLFCNLRCVFCQNWDISRHRSGRECTAEEIALLMLDLERRGCHNMNFVTAYDSVESLRLMEGLVDIYMPDFKFWSAETSRRLARAADYPERAREAILEMHRQVGDLVVGADGLGRRGLLVRHLVMPGQEAAAEAIFRWLAAVSPDTHVNVMGQYRPEFKVSGAGRYVDVDRRPEPAELQGAYAAARRAGLWRFDQGDVSS